MAGTDGTVIACEVCGATRLVARCERLDPKNLRPNYRLLCRRHAETLGYRRTDPARGSLPSRREAF